MLVVVLAAVEWRRDSAGTDGLVGVQVLQGTGWKAADAGYWYSILVQLRIRKF